MRYIAILAVMALVACDEPAETIGTQSFISYNGVSEEMAHAKCDMIFDYPAATLPDHHAACVRMVRADYCGDGTSWTTDGQTINLYDNLGINTDDADWTIDATWSPDGALCVNRIRDYQPGSPACVVELFDAECGGFGGGALLVSETP